MSKGGHFEKKTSRKGKLVGIIVICMLLASVLGVVVFANSYANDMLDEVNHVEVAKIDYSQSPVVEEEKIQMQAETVEAPAAPAEETKAAAPTEAAKAKAAEKYSPEDFVNMLIICKPAKETGEEGYVTQTMVLCTLNTKSKVMTMTALEEDAYVTTPEYKGHASQQMKLNAVYNTGAKYGNGKSGSMEFMNQTLYNNFGIEVDQNFEIDFQLFAKVVNRLKDVDLELSEEEAKYLSEQTKTELKAGKVKMDGQLATEYVKMWDHEEESGVTSISGQRKMVEAIVKKIRTQDIADLEIIVRDMLPMITTSMTRDEMKEFIISMLPMVRNLAIEKGEPCPVDGQRETVTVDGKEMEVVTFDVSKTVKAMQALTEGKN